MLRAILPPASVTESTHEATNKKRTFLCLSTPDYIIRLFCVCNENDETFFFFFELHHCIRYSSREKVGAPTRDVNDFCISRASLYKEYLFDSFSTE